MSKPVGSNTPFRRMSQYQKNTAALAAHAASTAPAAQGDGREEPGAAGTEKEADLHQVQLELVPSLQVDTVTAAGEGGAGSAGEGADGLRKKHSHPSHGAHRRTSRDQGTLNHSPGGTNHSLVEKKPSGGMDDGIAGAVDEEEEGEYDSESEDEDEEEGDEGDSDFEDAPPLDRLGGMKMSEMPFSPTHIPFTPTLSGAFKTSLAHPGKAASKHPSHLTPQESTPTNIPPPPPPPSSTSTVSPGPGSSATRQTISRFSEPRTQTLIGQISPRRD